MKTDTRDETTLTHSIRQFIHYKQGRCRMKMTLKGGDMKKVKQSVLRHI